MYNASGSAVSLPVVQPDFLVPAYSVSTRHLPPRLQYSAWLELISPIVEIAPEGDPLPGFAAEQVAWDLGGLLLTRSIVPDHPFRRTAYRIRADGIDHWQVSSVSRGTLGIAAGDRIANGVPGIPVLHSLKEPSDGVARGLEVVDLFIPRDFCRDAASALDAAGCTGMATGLAALLADYLLDLERRLPQLRREELPGLLASIRSMIVASALPSRGHLVEARASIQASMLERARRLVQRRLLSPTLGASELCRELGVSRSRLYRLFEPLGGVVHYIRRRRLLDAHHALADPEETRTIVEIATERGFIDAAEFSRAFKREFGYRPTDARARGKVWPLRHERGRSGQETLSSLLRRLQ